MKTRIVICFIALIAVSAMARLTAYFSSWSELEDNSPNILIARCGKPIHRVGTIVNGTASDSAIEIIFPLKGECGTNSAQLLTDYTLQEGGNYLVFGYYKNGKVLAFEEYRVIPLGLDFSTNSIAGKPLADQLQILYKRRIAILNQEILNDEAEKKRLQTGIKEP